MGPLHAAESTAPDHPLLLLLADIAAGKNVPIDIHFDIFPETIPTPRRLCGVEVWGGATAALA